MNFIKEYQGLIGSFLAVIGSVFVVWLTTFLTKKREIRNNKKEIDKIFLMAIRESEDSLRNIKNYVLGVWETLKKIKDEINVGIPPKFNRIYINEERLFLLCKGLNFIASQQVDIAISSAKKFNGYMDQIEHTPMFLFDSNVKIFQSGLVSREKFIRDYTIDVEHFLKNTELMIDKNIIIIQRHLLRPVAALAYKDRVLNNLLNADEILDKEANIILLATKADLVQGESNKNT